MSWRVEKTDAGQDLVWDGVEFGIAPSPTKGTANIQNANISTESGEIMASYGRVSQTPASLTNQTLTPNGDTDFTGPANLQAGQWISVSASTVSSINVTAAGTGTIDYVVVAGGGGGGGADSAGSNLDAVAGGGGAGEVAIDSTTVSVGSYAITIGEGGDGGTTAGTAGSDGTDSSIGVLAIATGGGGGGGSDSLNGRNGGSGGGGGYKNGSGSGTGGTGNPDNDGAGGGISVGGGGGGAGAVGGAGGAGVGGEGGSGITSSITGTPTFYGGGGGGGASGGVSADGGAGGDGGGGDGGAVNGSGSGDGAGHDATINTGGGGGGAGQTDGTNSAGGDGGSGIVIISYPIGSMIAVGGDVNIVGSNMVHTFTEDGSFKVLYIAQTNLYYVSYKNGTTYRLSSKFDPTGANALTHGTTGTVTFSTVAVPNQAIAKATEKYTTATGVEYRYYMLDANSYVWVYDTLIFDTYGTKWMLSDPNDYSSFRLTGLGVLNGMVLTVGKAYILGKPVTDLGRVFIMLNDVYLNEPFPTHNNFALVGNQGKMYYCDGNYIGEVFATTSLLTGIANIQSLCSYTSSTTSGTVSAIVSGSLPYSPDGTRIPAVFFTDVYGTQPSNLTAGTLYYIAYNADLGTFEVYSALTGGSAKNIATGAAGNQFFTTFFPFGSTTGNNGSTPLVQVSTQRVNLPSNEVAQCMVEVGNTVIIGGITNLLYPWNQVDATPSDFIALPESNVTAMVNANNMAYVFAGNKGNIYITNNSVASLALKVPDYCAGVPGTPLTYIEPYFTWGGAEYLRGRVYFSILDQTATKAGNCGGIWSFVPSQNIDPSQEVGLSLRLENQNSYADYDGFANLILKNEEQLAVSPQYWSFWQDSYSTGTSTFGIDYTNTVPVTTYVVETDLLPTGTLLDKKTFEQLEYKLTTPLASGDSVQMFYRLNSTDAWTTCGTTQTETDNPISGYYNVAFQKTQWTQIRAVVTTTGTVASSFVRLKQIRIR